VTGVQGAAAGLPGLLGEGSQDAVVCHDLLTRVDDQAALLASLAGVLAEGGVLSLGFANRDWLALRAGRRGDHAGALRLVEGGDAITLTEAERLLAKAGLALVAASGVGVFAEAGDDDLNQEERATLIELERQVAGREPYRSSARTLHLVARRGVFRPELTGYTP
jgi:S-adenosylmethionine-dependent methyltransferase